MSIVHDDVKQELLLFGVPIASIRPYEKEGVKKWMISCKFPTSESPLNYTRFGGTFLSVEQCIVHVMSQLAWFMWSIGANHTAAGFGEGEPVLLVTGGYRGGRTDPRTEWALNQGVVRAHDASVETKIFMAVERVQRLVLRSPIDFTGLEYKLWEGEQYYGDAPAEESAATEETTDAVQGSDRITEDADHKDGDLPRE